MEVSQDAAERGGRGVGGRGGAPRSAATGTLRCPAPRLRAGEGVCWQQCQQRKQGERYATGRPGSGFGIFCLSLWVFVRLNEQVLGTCYGASDGGGAVGEDRRAQGSPALGAVTWGRF